MGRRGLVEVLDEDNSERFEGIGKEAEGAVEEGARDDVDEDELEAAMVEEDGDSTGIEAGVHCVENGAAHRHDEVHVVHGRSVGGRATSPKNIGFLHQKMPIKIRL